MQQNVNQNFAMAFMVCTIMYGLESSQKGTISDILTVGRSS